MSAIFCTVCSKAKDENPLYLPARKRYLGTHIPLVEELAKKAGLPFFILSGEFGLIGPDETILYYDHVLEENEVSSLAEILEKQLCEWDITQIRFYTKNKEIWNRYRGALTRAVTRIGIEIEIRYLPSDA